MNQEVCETASRISLHTTPSRCLPGLISLSMLSLITSVSISLPWLLRHSIIRYYQSVSCCQGTSNCTFHPLYKKTFESALPFQPPALLSFPTVTLPCPTQAGKFTSRIHHARTAASLPIFRVWATVANFLDQSKVRYSTPGSDYSGVNTNLLPIAVTRMKLSPSMKVKIVRGASWLRKEPHSWYRGSEISGCLSDFNSRCPSHALRLWSGKASVSFNQVSHRDFSWFLIFGAHRTQNQEYLQCDLRILVIKNIKLPRTVQNRHSPVYCQLSPYYSPYLRSLGK
jgi:hypothetical protein